MASFKGETAHVREKIDPSGEIVDHASPELRAIRERLRKQRTRLRGTLESYLRGKETAKYLQDQVVTERNGRYVIVIKAEHRSSIPGIVHGTSTSGASLFLEPLSTVEINNDIVALEEQELEEVRRILLALTDEFRGRAGDLHRHDRRGHRARRAAGARAFLALVDGVEPQISSDGAFELQAARHPLLMPDVMARLERTSVALSEGGRTEKLLMPPQGARSGHDQDRSSRNHPARHRPEHRREDGGAQDGRLARPDGPGGAAHPGGGWFAASRVPIALRRHRRRAVD